jgi:signal transduction histidine kinase
MMVSRQTWLVWKRRFWAVAGAVSIRAKILGIILGLVILLGVGLTAFVRQSLHRAMHSELELLAVSVTSDLASRSTDLILVNNLYALYELTQKTRQNYPDIRYILILDKNDQPLVSTFGNALPAGLLQANQPSPEEPYRLFAFNSPEGWVLDAAVPIFDGRAGMMRVGFSETSITRTVNAVTSQLLLATLLVSTIGILSSIFLTWVLTRPILALARAAQMVGRGNFDQYVERWADDEIGELTEAFNQMTADLRLAAEARRERERLRAEMVEKVISAQEDERRRIARDLHDQTSQALVSLIVQLKLVESARNKASRLQAITDLREQLRATLNDVRRMAYDLRPGVLDDLGLTQAIQWFADQCRKNNGVEIKTRIDAACDSLPPHAATAVYRVAQEALSNVVKHSRATQAWITLRNTSETYCLEIRDNGAGFRVDSGSAHTEGLGLFGMRERIQLLGGTFELETELGQGTIVRAILPCIPKEDNDDNRFVGG